MKWYICYEDYVWTGTGDNTYTREVHEGGNCPYDTKEEAQKDLQHWKSVDPVQYGKLFVIGCEEE